MQQTTTEIQTSKIPLRNINIENVLEAETVKTHRWTKNEYYQLAELGFFQGKRVELIEGEIIKMAPVKSFHATAVLILNEILGNKIKGNFHVRSQLVMDFGNSQPEPDFAVVKGKIRDYAKSHPKKAELVVEVSDATLSYDRNRKASLYAENKIQDYWILNLNGKCLEVYRKPKKDKQLGFIYSERLILTEEDSVSPLANPKAKIKIADILP